MRKPKWQKNFELGVPSNGWDAFYSAWDNTANPHEETTVAHRWWIADWWRANAVAFESHVHGHDPSYVSPRGNGNG